MLNKLQQFSRRKPCYYCGALPPPPSEKEHAPPRMMFKGFTHAAITVPSCDAHNYSKHLGDQAIVTAIAWSAHCLMQDHPESPLLTNNVRKAINILQPQFAQASNQVELRLYLNLRLPYLQPSAQIQPWMRQLTAALVWSAVGRKDPLCNWDEACSWSPTWRQDPPDPLTKEGELQYWRAKSNLEQSFNTLTWSPGWSHIPHYPQDIYSFELSFMHIPEIQEISFIFFRHRFYNGISTWYVGFAASKQTAQALTQAVSRQSLLPATR